MFRSCQGLPVAAQSVNFASPNPNPRHRSYTKHQLGHFWPLNSVVFENSRLFWIQYEIYLPTYLRNRICDARVFIWHAHTSHKISRGLGRRIAYWLHERTRTHRLTLTTGARCTYACVSVHWVKGKYLFKGRCNLKIICPDRLMASIRRCWYQIILVSESLSVGINPNMFSTGPF